MTALLLLILFSPVRATCAVSIAGQYTPGKLNYSRLAALITLSIYDCRNTHRPTNTPNHPFKNNKPKKNTKTKLT